MMTGACLRTLRYLAFLAEVARAAETLGGGYLVLRNRSHLS